MVNNDKRYNSLANGDVRTFPRLNNLGDMFRVMSDIYENKVRVIASEILNWK